MNNEEESKEIDLLEYWRLIVKRKWIIIAFTTVLILFVGFFSFTATPIYRANATLLIEESSSGMLSIREFLRYVPIRSYDYMNRDFNTQLTLLNSRALAERVAMKMNLRARPEFQSSKKPRKSLVQSIKSFISFRWLLGIIPRKKTESQGQEPRRQPDPNSVMAFAVLGGLSVSPIKDTRMVQLSYSSPYPVLAADIVNTVAEEFIDYSIETRYEATQQASEFLTEEIANLREELAAKERELQKYGQEKKILLLSARENSVVSKFSELDTAYTQAQIDRINKETYYRELKDLKVDSLPQFVNNPLIQNLKERYADMKNEYDENSKIFKPDYPKMIQLKAGLDSMKEELKSEIKKAVDAAESEYRSVLKKESSLKTLLDEQRAEVARMNSNAILYNSLKIEVENKRMLLNSLGAKQNEALVSARLGGLKTSNIKIIDKALVPGAPVSPNPRRNLMLALLAGIFGGVGLCFLLDYLDNTVKGPADVEKLAGLPSLGVIPYLPLEGMKKKKRYGFYTKYKHKYSYGKENSGSEENLPEIKEIELINHLYPKFFISEDYRTVRTSILFSHTESPPKTIAFTSALPKEGKTATVANMAVAFSQLEQRVLLVDSDLRKPRLHRLFKVKNIGGLSGYLTGKISIDAAVQRTNIENIWLIPSGPIPPNPAELLNSNKMREMMEELKKGFDVLLLDSPPVLLVVDPVIIASLADSTVCIIQAGKTTRKPFLRAVDELRHAKAKIIGVLFNEAKAKGEGYYSPYFHYYGYHYYGEEEKTEETQI